MKKNNRSSNCSICLKRSKGLHRKRFHFSIFESSEIQISGVDTKNKEKQEIVKRYFETERKLILANDEIEKLQSQISDLELELDSKDEKIQTLLSYING